ncbi:hypothetical protein LENED_004272 [Lentinula edodes]|uniref:Uncharacterized protein n=1 Tax=Lentinula edodes TaxID=5353 RepID=A0A1Q3E5V8_LENED|nr:hypothetical protein LENED_004272 [Lentinula edodes]
MPPRTTIQTKFKENIMLSIRALKYYLPSDLVICIELFISPDCYEHQCNSLAKFLCCFCKISSNEDATSANHVGSDHRRPHCQFLHIYFVQNVFVGIWGHMGKTRENTSSEAEPMNQLEIKPGQRST